MTTQRRTAVAVSDLALLAVAHFVTGCTGVFENSLSGLGSGSDCIRVKTGEWEFDLSMGGHAFLTFVEGDLTQSGCLLSYDEDQVFQGFLSGSTWNVSSAAGGFSFIGSFSGSPATSFSGTFRDSENLPAAISGRYVDGTSTLAEARALCNESGLAGRGRAMTDAEWNDLVAMHKMARDEGLSRNNAITFGNFTCGAESNELCIRCNIALVDALWP